MQKKFRGTAFSEKVKSKVRDLNKRYKACGGHVLLRTAIFRIMYDKIQKIPKVTNKLTCYYFCIFCLILKNTRVILIEI